MTTHRSLRWLLATILPALAVLVLVGGAAWAGTWSHERNGAVLGFNVGAGSAGVNVDLGGATASSDRETGEAGSLRLGYAVQQNLVLGFEANGWAKTFTSGGYDTKWSFGVGTLGATWYPAHGGFFMRGGVGFGRAQVEFSNSQGTQLKAHDSGLGMTAGLGYEWRLTRTFALGPQVDFGYLDVGNGFTANYVNFTLGLNWFL
jgi:hypothetical protein